MNLEVTFHSADPNDYKASAGDKQSFGALPPVTEQDVLTSSGTADPTSAVADACIARVMPDAACRVHWGVNATATASVGMKMAANQEAFLLLAPGARISMISI